MVKTKRMVAKRAVPKGLTRGDPARIMERNQRLLRCAGELFLTHGYAGVSIEMIVAEAGGSYRDIYREYGDKEALFRRVISRICGEVLAPLRLSALDTNAQNMPIEEALFNVARVFLNAALSRRVLALHRLIVSEAARFPKLAEIFLAMGPDTAYATIGAFVQARCAAEHLTVDEPNLAARLFLDMITADLQLRALTGSTLSQSDIDARVRAGTRLFIAGLREIAHGQYRRER